MRCRVSEIYNLLLETEHNGFPLVSRKDGKLKGEIWDTIRQVTPTLSQYFCGVLAVVPRRAEFIVLNL